MFAKMRRSRVDLTVTRLSAWLYRAAACFLSFHCPLLLLCVCMCVQAFAAFHTLILGNSSNRHEEKLAWCIQFDQSLILTPHDKTYSFLEVPARYLQVQIMFVTIKIAARNQSPCNDQLSIYKIHTCTHHITNCTFPRAEHIPALRRTWGHTVGSEGFGQKDFIAS